MLLSKLFRRLMLERPTTAHANGQIFFHGKYAPRAAATRTVVTTALLLRGCKRAPPNAEGYLAGDQICASLALMFLGSAPSARNVSAIFCTSTRFSGFTGSTS